MINLINDIRYFRIEHNNNYHNSQITLITDDDEYFGDYYIFIYDQNTWPGFHQQIIQFKEVSKIAI